MNVPRGFKELARFRVSHSLPVFLQENDLECGLVCISMLSYFYGRPLTIELLRELYSVGPKGLNVRTLMAVIEGIGFGSNALEGTLEEVLGLDVPAILHLKNNHYVVLRRGNEVYCHLHDPLKGRVRIQSSALALIYSGVSIVVYPCEGMVPGGSYIVSIDNP